MAAAKSQTKPAQPAAQAVPAAALTAPATPNVAAGDYHVGRPQGQCAACGRAIAPGDKMTAALVETQQGYQRADVCPDCWPNFGRDAVVAFWQTAMPRAEERKKQFVDDAVLADLFERLADAEEPAKVNFRFVLGLILMRKRLVVYESTRKDGEREVWAVRLRGREGSLELVNPRLDEGQMLEVSQQLSQILNEGL